MNSQEELYTVGEVAQALKVTVRSLHHWESMGLITPTERSWSNYRLYTADDIERIEQIIIYRATGMKLTEIKKVLNSASSRLEHLRMQRESLIDQKAQLEEMVQAIDTLMEKEMNNEKLSLEEIGDILGDAKIADYQREAEEKYGETDDWKISQQRTAYWTAQDWSDSRQRCQDVDNKLAQAARDGVAIDSEQAEQLVEEHRQLLSVFFPVSYAKQYLISRSYVNDERFARYYNEQQPGLAQWLAGAIEHVAVANGVDVENPVWE
ncbi:MerR family transcriptional regulator [Alloscardovia omnicolens]|uniref:MerR family transcriptional regulator n=1 Tax=Alloscardovia omnicolens TaxID=419015 RepID=UPI0003B52662|nr:MerR family transcriptional regulator [Alloscardovia omnicolens]